MVGFEFVAPGATVPVPALETPRLGPAEFETGEFGPIEFGTLEFGSVEVGADEFIAPEVGGEKLPAGVEFKLVDCGSGIAAVGGDVWFGGAGLACELAPFGPRPNGKLFMPPSLGILGVEDGPLTLVGVSLAFPLLLTPDCHGLLLAVLGDALPSGPRSPTLPFCPVPSVAGGLFHRGSMVANSGGGA